LPSTDSNSFSPFDVDDDDLDDFDEDEDDDDDAVVEETGEYTNTCLSPLLGLGLGLGLELVDTDSTSIESISWLCSSFFFFWSLFVRPVLPMSTV